MRTIFIVHPTDSGSPISVPEDREAVLDVLPRKGEVVEYPDGVEYTVIDVSHEPWNDEGPLAWVFLEA